YAAANRPAALRDRAVSPQNIAQRLRRRPGNAISERRSLRLAAQDVALSRRKRGFESPRERHFRITNSKVTRPNCCTLSVGALPRLNTNGRARAKEWMQRQRRLTP